MPQDSTPRPSSDESPEPIEAVVAAVPANGKPASDHPVADDPETHTSGEPVAETAASGPSTPVSLAAAPSGEPATEPDPAEPSAPLEPDGTDPQPPAVVATDAAPAVDADTEPPAAGATEANAEPSTIEATDATSAVDAASEADDAPDAEPPAVEAIDADTEPPAIAATDAAPAVDAASEVDAASDTHTPPATDTATATEPETEQPRDEPINASTAGAAANAGDAPDADTQPPTEPATDAPLAIDVAPDADTQPPTEPAIDAAPATDVAPDAEAGTDADGAPEAIEEAEPQSNEEQDGDAEPDRTAAHEPRATAGAAAASAVATAAKGPAAMPRGAAASPWDLEPGWDPAEEKQALRQLTARHRGPVWARALVVFGTVLVLASVTGLIAGKALLDRYAGSVHQESLLGGARATAPGVASGVGGGEVQAAPIDGPLNILLVGIDERVYAPADGARADSIIIVHVPANHEAAYFISVPRDSRVQIPAYPKTGYEGGTDKINAAFAYGFLNGGGRSGGFELLALTLKQLTGISFNAGAIIDFDGFRSVVDAMGGVYMCVDEQTTSVHIGWDANGKETPPYRIVAPDYTAVKIPGIRAQVYQVGCQTMAGWEALDYVRQRELLPDGDYGRERHQQQFLKAVAKKLTSLGVIGNPLRLDSVLRSAANTLTFDGGGYSVTDWLFNLKAISPGNITMMKTNGGQFNTKYIGGQAFEILDDTSLALFQAAKDDTVDQFVQAHSDWVSGDSPVVSTASPTPSN